MAPVAEQEATVTPAVVLYRAELVEKEQKQAEPWQ